MQSASITVESVSCSINFAGDKSIHSSKKSLSGCYQRFIGLFGFSISPYQTSRQPLFFQILQSRLLMSENQFFDSAHINSETELTCRLVEGYWS
jgi:hypothetical protein